MASIRERGKKFQVVWYDLAGVQRYHTLPAGSTRAQAKRLQREIEALADEGVDWIPGRRRVRPQLGTMIEDYNAHRARTKKKATADGDRYVLAMFARWLLEQERHPPSVGPEILSIGLLDRFHAHLAAGKKASTVGLQLNKVLHWWKWAHARREDYPGVPMPPFEYETPRAPPSPTLAPTWDQVDQMLAKVGYDPSWRCLVLMRMLGLRVSQALRLEWRDVDLDGQTFHVRPELGKTRTESAGRLLPLPEAAVEVLAGWGVREGPIVPPVNVNTVKHHALDAWRASGVPERFWRGRSTHAIRKSFVTEARVAGCDRDAVEHYVGHSTELAGVYTDARALPLLAVAKAVPRLDTGARVLRLPARG